ncbi:MAG TPA: RNA methyltransferase [Pseudogracilibacillus sp.]|nr:RNA methyltransferase [Pseudogracilibacillus sp.]
MSMITSVQNSMIKEIKKLHQKKYRELKKQFLVEGFHLLSEAHQSEFVIDQIIIREDTDIPDWVKEEEIVFVSYDVFDTITQTETPQGIAAVVNKHEFANKLQGHVLLLDAIQDPGNLGTMIRTAEAAGFTKVVLGKGTVDPYNDKVLRATQGAIFHLPVILTSLNDEIRNLKMNDYEVWAATLEDSEPYQKVEVNNRVALIIGNEGAGISKEIITLADKNIVIPIFGQTESLNAGIAAGILMYYLQTSFAR